MAEPTTDAGLLPRTYFRAPRVPFDFRAVTIAVLGYLVYWGGCWVLFRAFDPVNPVAAFFQAFLEPIARIPFVGRQAAEYLGFLFVPDVGVSTATVADFTGPTFWHKLVGGVWVFLVWAFFGQAIHRIISLRIARDEGLTVREGMSFAAKNFATIALCPLIVAAAIGLFYGCNALAGLVISIPYVGQFLGLILVPLAMLSTLIIILIAIGGVLGLPLVAAAAAWERNGSLDAISRAFSYIFARPLQFFWNYLLIFLFVGIILLVGGYFSEILVESVDAGTLTDGASAAVHAETLDQVKATPFKDAVTAFVFWLLSRLIWVIVVSYAIYWFFGATTSTYADLRADVDGTEEDEIYLEDEEEDFEALAKSETPAMPPPPPAPLPPPPTSGPGSPPPPVV